MSQGVFERRERRTRSCWPVIRQLVYNAALPHSGQRQSVTEHQLPCFGEVKTTSHNPSNLDRVASGELPTEYIGKRNMIVYEPNHGTVLLTEGFHFTIED